MFLITLVFSVMILTILLWLLRPSIEEHDKGKRENPTFPICTVFICIFSLHIRARSFRKYSFNILITKCMSF